MNHLTFSSRALTLACVASFMFGSISYAQEALDVRDLTEQELAFEGEKALVAGNHEFALKAFDELISINDDVAGAKEKFGDLFGAIHFARGMARKASGDIDGAIEDFKTSVEVYNGRAGDRPNPMIHKAKFQWGVGLVEKEDYANAIRLLDNFEKTAPQRDKLAVGYDLLYSSRAKAYLETGDLAKAREHIEILSGVKVLNKDVLIKPQAGFVMQLFVRYANLAVERGDYQGLRILIKQIRAWSVNRPHEIYPAFPELMSLSEKLTKEDTRNYDLGLLVLSLVPQEQQVRDSALIAKGKLPGTHPQSDLANRVLESIDEQKNKGEPYDLAIILNQAIFYQRFDDYRTSLALYLYAKEYFGKDVQFRKEIIYGAVVSAFQSNDVMLVNDLANEFFAEFPDDEEYGPDINQLNIENRFFKQDYALALDLAREVRPSATDGTELAQMCDFVIAGSLFYLQENGEAFSAIQDWLKTYGDKEDVNLTRKELMSFAQIDLLAKRKEWQNVEQNSAKHLEEFGEGNPTWVGQVYLFLAEAQLNLKKLQDAFDTITKLEGINATYTPLRDRVAVMKGRVLRDQELNDKAFEAWTQAEEFSRELGNPSVGAQAMFYYISAISTVQGKEKEAVEAFDAFMGNKDYSNSVFMGSVAIAVGKPLLSVGRRDDHLAALRKAFERVTENTNFGEIDKYVSSFSGTFMSAFEDKELGVKLEETKKLGDELLRIAEASSAPMVKASVLIGMSNNYRLVQQKATPGDAVELEAAARIRATLDQLDRDFDPASLAPQAMIALAEYLFAEGEPARAQTYFQAANEGAKAANNPVLARKSAVGLGESLVLSPNRADWDKAMNLFSLAIPEGDTGGKKTALQGRALIGKAEASEKLGDMNAAADFWKEYLNGPWKADKARASYRLAETLQKSGDKGGALAMYARVVNVYSKYFKYSIPAVLKETEMRISGNQAPEGIYARLDLIYQRFNPSMERAKLIESGFSVQETSELIKAWKEVEKIHSDYRAQFEN